MEKMQEYIDYIFNEVWCKAPGKEYDISLFDRHSDLRKVIEGFHFTEPRGAEFFIKGIQEIFRIFNSLSPADIFQLKTWYQSNNDIENLCRNDPAVTPSTYSNIKQMNLSLGTALNVFFTGLYSNDFLSLKVLADSIGEVGGHYKEFVKINRKGKCPYCGLQPIDGQHDHTREAYDHYLPKSKYPFSTINFKNLAPICGKCNSSGNKGAKDPLNDKDGRRRKAFYSYNVNTYDLEINITLSSNDIEKLTPQDITITFGPSSLEEELGTWNDLFNIEERYKAKCCSDDAWYWMTQIFDERADKTPSEFLEIRLENAGKYPFNETNFLLKPFLEACKDLQLFTENHSFASFKSPLE